MGPKQKSLVIKTPTKRTIYSDSGRLSKPYNRASQGTVLARDGGSEGILTGLLG